ncbi:MAG TPA: SGNH/GDSL hydrolase family protein [Syntrophomonadaceae bacterium]|nr:SGNH/GDSL hydrolase family protein [Syntrophomonadaceae bacterium]
MAKNNKLRIVCLGDSITYGFPFGPQYSWVNMLSHSIDAEVINRGINGNTTTEMLERFERHVLQSNPTHVIIMGGINDVLCRESYDRITWNLRVMAEKVRENKIQVVLGIPTPVDEPEFERLINRIRLWIKDYAFKNGINIIDFASAFYDENDSMRTEMLMPDGGHPTEEGYRAMYNTIDLGIFQSD